MYIKVTDHYTIKEKH